ncbi:MAG: pyridoxamine 5'-phosphate oxidase family protein, partial [Microbacteriaceae bacterium]
CGRYISERHSVEEGGITTGIEIEAGAAVELGTELSDAQIATIRAADTFFIGTSHPDGPADASHRGGNPGFVIVDSPQTLRWPDYNGNAMFMTLGNITLNPRVGLLFPDWATGGLLQVSGRAHVDWATTAAAQLPGAERVVKFTVDAVQQTPRALSTRWSPSILSRYNPRMVLVA